jgi:maltose/maltodextrin transport system substrate-binding protein
MKRRSGEDRAANVWEDKTMKRFISTIAGAAFLLGSTSLTFALEEGKLLIWIGVNRDEAALGEIAKKFTDDLGVPVTIEVVDPDLAQKFQQAAATGDGPDIVLWVHDRFGEWAQGGLISAVEPSPEMTAGILESAWDAVTFGGKTWGYPVFVESIGLVYNKDLVPTPPATFEEIAALSVPEGKTRIMWDYNNAYFTMPLLMANGGYAFQKKDGVYDGKDTGVNNEGAIMGGEMLKKLIDDGSMPKGVDSGITDATMAKGDVAMIINGPWSWPNYEQAGINFGVAPLPSINGQPSKPFIGVGAFVINAASPNQDLAEELITNYILTDEGVAAWNGKGMLGATANIAAGATTSDNVKATLANAAVGVPMPSNPEMGAFWAAVPAALSNITSGAQEVKPALDDAAKRILGE